jgi:hypothetical protein
VLELRQQHRLRLMPGPGDGTIRVHTYREGAAQKLGHDLILDVTQWSAQVDVGDDGAVASLAFEADPRSLEVLEGLHGLKPLSDKDRAEIRKNIDAKVLGGAPISFRSDSVEQDGVRLAVSGKLTVAGQTRPASYSLELSPDHRLTGTLSLTQSEFGIKPFRGLMGALKVRDDVEVVLDVAIRS